MSPSPTSTSSLTTREGHSWPEPKDMESKYLVQEYGALRARSTVAHETWVQRRKSKIVDELRSRGLLP